MIHFLLAHDQSSALALKRKVAELVPGCGVIAGGWFELLGLIRNAFLCTPANNLWQMQLEAIMCSSQDCFWNASLEAVSTERPAIFAAIDKTLTMLLEAAGPFEDIRHIKFGLLSDRATRHLNDLLNLHQAMGGTLPPHLELIAQVLRCPPDRQIRQIHVYHYPGWPKLDAWQRALVERLNQSSPPNQRYSDVLEQSVFTPTASEHSALGMMQRHLFKKTKKSIRQDATLQCLAVRDHLQEAEIAAGMVQQALRDTPELRPADFALLLPSDRRYNISTREVFSVAGLPISGLRAANTLRDIGSESIEHLLLCMNKPAPVLALTSLLTSPLMPWEPGRGNQLAQQVMKGDFGFKEWTGCNVGTHLLLSALRNPPESSSELARLLKCIQPHLDASERMEMHLVRATAALKRVVDTLDASNPEIPWHSLHSLCFSEPLPMLIPVPTQEGIAIFYEGEEPWRQVKHLIVLGCSEGHYPAPIGHSPVFGENDLQQLADHLNGAVLTSASHAQRLREIFRRQLCSASDTVTFLIPRRDPLGNSLATSSSSAFIANQLLDENDCPIDQSAMILELETEQGQDSARGLALAIDVQLSPPRKPIAVDLNFPEDLLKIGMREDTSLKPESPSRLETLMVSPLAWLFDRLGVSARDWAPEALDVMTKGTLAHAVFENLFAPGRPLPHLSSIDAAVPSLLAQAIRSHCPFLQRSEWMTERQQLQQEILRAAQRWAEILVSTHAEVLATEISLQGFLDDVPIHGNADLLIALPGKRLYVVDYKKSSSSTRWRRMSRGYDHQAALYRTMIQTGGLKKPETAPNGLAEQLAAHRDTGEIGAMYFLMNDQNVLTDTRDWLPRGLGGVQEMGDAIADASMHLIRNRFTELREGRIILNHPEDEVEFKDNRGITPYALDSSPLVRMFMKQDSTTPDVRDK